MPSAQLRPILALDASSSCCSAVLWEAPHGATSATSGTVLGSTEQEGPTGEAALLPRMAANLLTSSAITVRDLAAIAVTVGPGSFTGLRASLAFAEGMAAGAGIRVIGVTVAEALALAARAQDTAIAGLPLWCALDARHGRIFLHRGGAPADWEVGRLDEPPLPEGPIALIGDAAESLGIALRRACVQAFTTAARQPHAREVAVAGAMRMLGILRPLAAVPLYIDPPRALLPRGGLRPPPGSADNVA
jgi:tRNA threonylcarbamoyladenosine biosynthesis protein TsaB